MKTLNNLKGSYAWKNVNNSVQGCLRAPQYWEYVLITKKIKIQMDMHYTTKEIY